MAQARGSFGILLRHYRAEAGLSQGELAERSGLSQRAISDLERGARRAPYPVTVRLLVEALGLSAGDRAALLSASHKPAVATMGETSAADNNVRYNLPLELTSFVGRVQETADIRRALAKTRLLTLTGPGGVGKTRLALRVAEQELTTYRDGVWWVDLAPVRECAQVAQLVARELRIRVGPDEGILSTLTAALQPLNLLLILDNCEHVISICADLAYCLLHGCPQLRLLTTSREILGVRGEAVRRVPPMTLPVAETPGDVAESEAIQLFVERAQAVRPDFVLTDRNTRPISDICRTLDGIPLAIELAAARVRLLSLNQIQQRLSNHSGLLRSNSRITSDRHQTLRATIDWSYALLSDAERRLFHQLAVFVGGWTLEAAEVVCRAPQWVRDDVLDLIAALVDKSLVAVDPEGRDETDSRYRFLEIIRAYALERLVQSGELVGTHDRHLAWATDWAESAAPHLTGPDQVSWMARFVREHDNLRAALNWARERGDGGAELRLVAALARYGVVHGPTSEAREWFTHALACGPTAPSLARGTVLDWAGRLASLTGESGAWQLLDECVAMARELNDRSLLSLGLRHLAFAALQQGDSVAARALHEEALTTARQTGNRREEAFTLSMIGLWEAQQGDVAAASLLVDEALDAGRQAGDQGPQAAAYCASGIVAIRQGRIDSATACFQKALELGRSSEHHLEVAMALMQLGALALARGDGFQASEYARGCVSAAEDAGLRRLFAASLQFLACVEMHEHRYRRAVRIAAAETTWRQSSLVRQFLGLPWFSSTVNLDEAEDYLGPESFSREWSIGQRMTLEQAAALAWLPAEIADY